MPRITDRLATVRTKRWIDLREAVRGIINQYYGENHETNNYYFNRALALLRVDFDGKTHKSIYSSEHEFNEFMLGELKGPPNVPGWQDEITEYEMILLVLLYYTCNCGGEFVHLYMSAGEFASYVLDIPQYSSFDDYPIPEDAKRNTQLDRIDPLF